MATSNSTGNAIPAVLYLRRSDKHQLASILDQRKALKKYADQHGYRTLGEYVDDGISGDETEKRTAFLKMREDAAGGEFKAVLCWDQDRFGRFDSLDAGYWIYPFRRTGVQLVTVNEGPINWDDFTARMMYGIKQEAKHQFLRDLSRNVLRGQIEAAKNGSWSGGIPYAYLLQGPKKNKRLVVGDPSKVKVVKRIFREYVVEGRSATNVASRLTADGIPAPKGGRWRYDGVESILSNPAYIGTFRWNASSCGKYNGIRAGEITKATKRGRNDESEWIIIPGNHEAIIDVVTFNKAQAILAKGKTGRSPYTPENNPFLLSGKLVCGRCGAPMWGNQRRGKLAYTCGGQDYQGGCEGTSVLERDVLEHLESHILDEFLPGETYETLVEKAQAGEIVEADLPEAFKKLKRMFTGNVKAKADPKRVRKQVEAIDRNLEKARRNLTLLDPENIPMVQDEIRKMEDHRAGLLRDLSEQPSETDINDAVLDVLRKIVRLGLVRPAGRQVAKAVLREIDHITVFTAVSGQGHGLRHTFQRGEIHFRTVAGVTGKSNLRRLVQSQEAYH